MDEKLKETSQNLQVGTESALIIDQSNIQLEFENEGNYSASYDERSSKHGHLVYDMYPLSNINQIQNK